MRLTSRVFALAVAAASWAGGAAAEGTCRYDVALGPDLVLDVGVTCRAESGAPRFDPAAAPFAAFVSGFHDDGAATPLDLEDLMVRLGVHTTGEETVLDETAPLAWARHAIELGGATP